MMLMKKHEINGKNYKRAYRRHCSKKKLKQRSKKWAQFFYLPTYGKEEESETKSWSYIWNEIQSGNCGRWLRTTGKPCSCEGCSPTFKREPSFKILKNIVKDLEDEAEDSTLKI